MRWIAPRLSRREAVRRAFVPFREEFLSAFVRIQACPEAPLVRKAYCEALTNQCIIRA